MKVLVTTRLSEHKYKTPEGYLVCQDAILARTGAQEYYKSEVYETFEGEDGPIMVYRNEDQVFDPNTMASFEDKPITVEHPNESVNAENYRDLAVGHTRNVRRGTFNNQPVMIADLIITDAETIKDIESGVRTDLSCGYDCDITEGDKPEQINIRGNHVALCEQGRAGIARIIDSKSVKDDKIIPELIKKVAKKYNSDIELLGRNKLIIKRRDDLSYRESNHIMFQIEGDKDLQAANPVETEITKDGVVVKLDELSVFDSKSIKDYQYKEDYSIKINGNNAVVYKGSTKLNQFPTDKEAEEYIDELIKSKSLKNKPESNKKLKKFIYSIINNDDHESKITVMAENEKEARKKIKADGRVYRILGVTVKDTAVLPAEEKNKLSKYFGSISKFTPNDVDILDVVEPIKQMGFDLTREKINGWYKSPDGRYRKDYFFKINGYKDIFMISFYIKDDGKWKVDEVIAYFTGKSEPKKDEAPVKNGLGKYVIFNENNKLKGTTYNNYYLYGNPDKFEDFSDFTSQEELTEYLIDNRDIRRENIIYVKDAYTYKRPESINKSKLNELSKQLKNVNEEIGKNVDEEKLESVKHQKYLLKEKLLNEIKKTQSEIDENAEKGLDTNIKNWYKNNYELNDNLDDKVTFNDLFDTLNKKESVYDLLGIEDYKVIKRILQKLAELIKAPYDYVFDRWYSYEE